MSQGRKFSVVAGSADAHGRPTVIVAGEVDLSNAAEVTACLERVGLEREPAVVVDMSSVVFIDSSGLHELYRAHARQEAAGSTLILRSPSPRVLRVIELTNLDGVLRIDG
jgi:anti-sigma B factor antagonist